MYVPPRVIAGLALVITHALDAQSAPPAPLARPAAGAAGVLGIVADSIRGGGLAGAEVLIEGTRLIMRADNSGEFRFDSVPPGLRRFLLRHPLVDSIGIDIVSAPISLTAGNLAVVALAVPSAATLRRLLCAARDTADGTVMIRGRVADPDTDAPIAGAKVSFLYSQLRVSTDSGLRRVPRLRESTTRSDGTYTICGLPGDVAGTISASHNGSSTPEVPLVRTEADILFRPLGIEAKPTLVAMAAIRGDSIRVSTDSAIVVTVRQGHAKLEGRVVGPDSQPLADVQVAVTGTPQLAYTRADGSFTIEGLPSGTHEVLARRIGYAPASTIVELTAREPRTVRLALTRTPTLEPVRVVASLSARLERNGFYDRRKRGVGRFMDAEEIARRAPKQTTDIIRQIPGFRIIESEFGRRIEVTRVMSGQRGFCLNVFVDRARWEMNDAGDLDRALQVNEIAAIETYAGDFVPQEFVVPTKYCPTIVIWTKTRLDEK